MVYAVPAPVAVALRTSHVTDYRVTAYTPIQGVLTDVPISDGTVTFDAGSQVRRSADLTIADPTLWPVDPLAALSVVGSEIGIEYGVVLPGVGTTWIPLMRGPVQEVKRSRPSDTGLTVSVADRASWIVEARFYVPTQTLSGATVVSEITRLITEVRPDVTVTDMTGSGAAAAVLDIDRKRWEDGIEKLADSIQAEVYADRFGGFVIAPAPTFDGDPVWTVDAGPEGVLVQVDEVLSRERVYNAVVASGERTDGTPSVYAVATDDDVASPTYYGGLFGKRPFFYTSSLLTTYDQCLLTASARLDRVRGLNATVSVQTVPNPLLDPGDLIAVVPEVGGAPQLHVVDKITIPLTPGSPQSLDTRTISADATEGGEE